MWLIWQVIDCDTVQEQTKFNTKECLDSAKAKDWWNFVTSSSNDDSNWWHNNLRMSKSTFNYICCQLSPYIQKQNTQMHESVPVEQQVALTLWRLATNTDYHSIWIKMFNCMWCFHECCSSFTSTFCTNSYWGRIKGDNWRIWKYIGISTSCRGYWWFSHPNCKASTQPSRLLQ